MLYFLMLKVCLLEIEIMSMNELYAYCQHFHDNWSNPNIFACTSNTLTKPVDVISYKSFSTVGNTHYLII